MIAEGLAFVERHNISEMLEAGSPSYCALSNVTTTSPVGHRLPIPNGLGYGYASRALKPIRIFFFPEMSIDYRMLPTVNGEIVRYDDILPFYYDCVFLGRVNSARASIDIRKRTIKGPAYAVCTPKVREYGHFLVEILPRLLLVRNLWNNGFQFPVIAPASRPRYFDDFFKIILPNTPTIEVNDLEESVTISQVMIPSWGDYNPYIGELISSLIDDLSFDLTHRKKIIIRRQQFRAIEKSGDFRLLQNEQEIAETAQRYGFEPVEPQLLTTLEQIRMFAAAEAIIGEASSALHNAMFSPRGTSILALNAINPVQTFISGMRGHSIDYILPSDGEVRNLDNIGRVPKAYTIDVNAIEEFASHILKFEHA